MTSELLVSSPLPGWFLVERCTKWPAITSKADRSPLQTGGLERRTDDQDEPFSMVCIFSRVSSRSSSIFRLISLIFF